jgi:D-beta-D-heptose 7-phosphate kinase/D-beta-D-heptose 1-phosphate adenosyltransferase
MTLPFSLLKPLREELRLAGKTLVFTNGCFDILHVGHVRSLEIARKLGDVLIVGVNSDASVRRLKGAARPINTEEDRAAVLSALKSVDYTTIFDQDTPLELITELVPDVLAKGGDYTIETIVGADIVQNAGGTVVVIPLVAGKSTTKIVRKIHAVNVREGLS